MIYTIGLKNENAPKYNKGQKVITGYGKGKIIEIVALYDDKDKVYYVYRIKYSLFKKLWCFEDTISIQDLFDKRNKNKQRIIELFLQREELQDRIDKVIYDLEKVKEVNDKHILDRCNIVVHLDIDHIDYLLNTLKGDNK